MTGFFLALQVCTAVHFKKKSTAQRGAQAGTQYHFSHPAGRELEDVTFPITWRYAPAIPEGNCCPRETKPACKAGTSDPGLKSSVSLASRFVL